MNKIKLITLGCQRQTGKDTFCHLIQELNPNIKRVGFADSLKDISSDICYKFFNKYPFDLNAVEKELFRPILIEIGRLARTIDIDYWCKEVYSKIVKWNSNTAIYCITDMRYLNEYQYFKKVYGDSMIFINIERDGAPEPTDEEKIHAPELKKLANVNIEWQSDITFETLKPTVKEFYQKYIA